PATVTSRASSTMASSACAAVFTSNSEAVANIRHPWSRNRKRMSIGMHCSAASMAARVGRVLVACALFAMIAGCGSRFVYNRLDWISHYYLSNQVTLDDAQSRALQAELDDFLDWHRHSELPRYAGFLDRMASDATRPVSIAQLEAGQREVEGFLRDSAARAAPD